MEIRQITPFFIHFLRYMFLFVTFIFAFENSQNSFSCGLLNGPFCSVKYLNFGQKLPIRTAHHTFLESRHLSLLKIHITFCLLRGAKKTTTNGL